MSVELRQGLYLSGSIEYNDDPDTWRATMFHRLKRHFKVSIPWEDVCPYKKNDEHFMRWIRDNYILPDMAAVASCKYFFVRLDAGVFKGAGTISELSLAAWLNKHIIYMLDGIKFKDMPGWALGCLANAEEVKDIPDAIEYFKGLYKDTPAELSDSEQVKE